jgi:hypothetical protein
MANQAIAIKIAQGNATTAVHYTEHHDDNQSVWFVFIGCGEGLVDLGDFIRFHGVQRISGWKWQSRMKENLVFDH